MRCSKQLKLFNCVHSPQTHGTKSYLNKVFTTLKPLIKWHVLCLQIPRSFLAYNSTAESKFWFHFHYAQKSLAYTKTLS